jgi:hypothetical protein
MQDPRNGRTVIGFTFDDGDGRPLYACGSDDDGWELQWVGTTPPGSVWAATDEHAADPFTTFRVFPLYLTDDQLPVGASCEECVNVWDGRDWVLGTDDSKEGGSA